MVISARHCHVTDCELPPLWALTLNRVGSAATGVYPVCHVHEEAVQRIALERNLVLLRRTRLYDDTWINDGADFDLGGSV